MVCSATRGERERFHLYCSTLTAKYVVKITEMKCIKHLSQVGQSSTQGNLNEVL